MDSGQHEPARPAAMGTTIQETNHSQLLCKEPSHRAQLLVISRACRMDDWQEQGPVMARACPSSTMIGAWWAGGVAGVTSWLAVYPLDTVKAKLQATPVPLGTQSAPGGKANPAA